MSKDSTSCNNQHQNSHKDTSISNSSVDSEVDSKVDIEYSVHTLQTVPNIQFSINTHFCKLWWSHTLANKNKDLGYSRYYTPTWTKETFPFCSINLSFTHSLVHLIYII